MKWKNAGKEKVRIVEVGPRDGLQNESKVLDPETKKHIIEKICEAGLKDIEVASFVSEKAIPQMGNVAQYYPKIAPLEKKYKANFYSLIPNATGLKAAREHLVSKIAFFTSPSDSFNQKNLNATVEQSLERFEDMRVLLNKWKDERGENYYLRGYISMVFGCPYEGKVDVDRLFTILETYLNKWKFDEVSLGDTIGVATPDQVQALLRRIKEHFDIEKFALHLHDTRGVALVNAQAALMEGVRSFDTSLGGVGGCPYAKGASGNLATEDLVYLLHGQGFVTGVDLQKLVEASDFVSRALERALPGRVYHAYHHSAHLFKDYHVF